MTDANLVAGYLADGATFGGSVVLDGGAARHALEDLAGSAGLSPMDAAQGVIDVANAEMIRALRVVSVERGLDARDFALIGFGGAGPLHACALAEELGVKEVLVPQASGILSALGLAIADLRRDYVRPLIASITEVDTEELAGLFAEMQQDANRDLGKPQLYRSADLRYAGQSFELSVDATDLALLEKRFHGAHEQRYGYHSDDAAVEMVGLRLTATVERPKPQLRTSPSSDESVQASRRAFFDGESIDTPVLSRDRMGTGATLAGPAIVEFRESTCVVRPGWRGEIDDRGTLVLRAES